MFNQAHSFSHPFESGLSPWNGKSLIRSPEWEYSRGDDSVIAFAADPIGVLFCRVKGWSTETDLRAMIQMHNMIMQKLDWGNRPWVLLEDLSQMTGMELSARRLYVEMLFAKISLQGIAFCSPSPLVKLIIQLGITFYRPKFPAIICRGLSQGCNTAKLWLDPHTEDLLPEIPEDENSTQPSTRHHPQIDELIQVLSEVEWDKPGARGFDKVDIHSPWRPFLDVMSVLKRDLDNMITKRDQRLSELQDNYLRGEELQKEMRYALAESIRVRRVFELESARNMELTREVVNNQKETLFALGEIIETRSRETANHIRRVAEYSACLARHYGMDDREQQYILHASPMHDAGKVAIPDAILNKPGKLTIEEFEIMKDHSRRGWELLKGSNHEIMMHGATIAYQHHEKWNGKGYPNGLVGEETHIFGRIVALADVFDALGSDRCYKKAWPLEQILDLIKSEKSEHFDPNLVDLFFANIADFLQIRERYPDAT
jgi:response regulator RpfG family c-di-GMP phosphodiesterase